VRAAERLVDRLADHLHDQPARPRVPRPAGLREQAEGVVDGVAVPGQRGELGGVAEVREDGQAGRGDGLDARQFGVARHLDLHGVGARGVEQGRGLPGGGRARGGAVGQVGEQERDPVRCEVPVQGVAHLVDQAGHRRERPVAFRRAGHDGPGPAQVGHEVRVAHHHALDGTVGQVGDGQGLGQALDLVAAVGVDLQAELGR
jgi:hypothetical protein